MKKAFLTMSIAILLSVSGNCQWYNRRYGVNDINQLSKVQLNEALKRTQSRVTGGIILSGLGAIGIASGIIIISATNIEGVASSGVFTGLFIAEASLPIGLAGATIWGINGTRAKRIKEVLKSTELKIGLVNYQQENICSSSQGSLLPGLSVMIRF
jgi:hypothetical protein